MVSGATEHNVHPCSYSIAYEKHQSEGNEMVIPAEIPSEETRPDPKNHEKRGDTRKGTNDSEDLMLPTLDHNTDQWVTIVLCERKTAPAEASVEMWMWCRSMGPSDVRRKNKQ
jgi:hypothetical protein